MEPERRKLPAQLGDLAPRHADEPVDDQGVGEHAELRVEHGWVRVAAAPRRGLARQRRARPAQALGDGTHPLPIGLVRESASQLADDLGQLLRVAGEGAAECSVDPVGAHACRKRAHQPQGDRLVAPQQVVRLQPGGLDA